MMDQSLRSKGIKDKGAKIKEQRTKIKEQRFRNLHPCSFILIPFAKSY
jgi:hypothetical protein